MGNSQAIASKHYLHTTEGDFARATKAAHKAAQCASESGGNGGNLSEAVCVEIKENHVFVEEHEETEWAMRDSNPRHPLCKSGALTN